MLYTQPAKFSTYKKRDTNRQIIGVQLNEQMSENLNKIALQEAEQRMQTFKPSVVAGRITNKAKMDILDSYNKKARTRLLEATLGNIFYDALPLDTEFKERYKNNILHVMHEKVESMGDINGVLKELSEKSSFLNKVSKGVKDKADKLTSKKKQKMDESEEIDDLFCFEDEDDFKLDNIADVEVDEVSNMIKEKVISVVQDENDQSEKHKEMIEDIASAKAINESVCLVNNSRIEQHTLFKGMMINNYKQAINKGNNLSESSNYVSLSESGEVKVDMDFILCESMINYTLLETFYTLCIEDYSVNEIRKMSENLVYGKI